MTSQQIWFDRYVGLYGWLDTTFPGWVYELALLPGRPDRRRSAFESWSRAPGWRCGVALVELVVYCVICVGLLVLIGGDSYVRFPTIDAEYGQVRYLLPLLPLLGLVLALAARGAGRRWGPIVGASIVMLFVAHDVFSQLQEISLFYG